MKTIVTARSRTRMKRMILLSWRKLMSRIRRRVEKKSMRLTRIVVTTRLVKRLRCGAVEAGREKSRRRQ